MILNLLELVIYGLFVIVFAVMIFGNFFKK